MSKITNTCTVHINKIKIKIIWDKNIIICRRECACRACPSKHAGPGAPRDETTANIPSTLRSYLQDGIGTLRSFIHNTLRSLLQEALRPLRSQKSILQNHLQDAIGSLQSYLQRQPKQSTQPSKRHCMCSHHSWAHTTIVASIWRCFQANKLSPFAIVPNFLMKLVFACHRSLIIRCSFSSCRSLRY